MIKNNKNQNLNLNFIQERLKKYENYFHVLGLPYDESKNISILQFLTYLIKENR